jgi:hypothetical protein
LEQFLDKRSVEKASFYFLEIHGFNKNWLKRETLLVPEVRKSQSLSLREHHKVSFYG